MTFTEDANLNRKGIAPRKIVIQSKKSKVSEAEAAEEKGATKGASSGGVLTKQVQFLRPSAKSKERSAQD